MFGGFAFAQAYFAGVLAIVRRAAGRGVGGSGLPKGWNPTALMEQAAAAEKERRRRERDEAEMLDLLGLELL